MGETFDGGAGLVPEVPLVLDAETLAAVLGDRRVVRVVLAVVRERRVRAVFRASRQRGASVSDASEEAGAACGLSGERVRGIVYGKRGGATPRAGAPTGREVRL